MTNIGGISYPLSTLSLYSSSASNPSRSFKWSCHTSGHPSLPMATISRANEIGAVGDRLSALPVELFAIILPSLKLGDRIALSRTSRKFRALCAQELQLCVKDLLRRFNLGHAEIRFMQTATFTVLCGHCISHLVDYTFEPPQIDFVTPSVTYKSVVRFFELATGLEPRSPLLDNLYTSDGTTVSVKFGDPTQTNFIRVARSITDNALDSVTYAAFSHLIGAVTHYGLWLAYAQTSIRKHTMPNRDCLDFTDPATDDRIQIDYSLLHAHFEIDSELRWFHECGRTWECPMTPRTTVDNGCLSLFFPNPPMGQTDAPSNVYPSKTSMAWSLGGRCCSWGMKSVNCGVEMHWWQKRLRFDGCKRTVCGISSDLTKRPVEIGMFLILLLCYLFILAPGKQYLSLRTLDILDIHNVRGGIGFKEHFLANTVHGIDFIATRDRGAPGGSRWSFKRCDQDDVTVPSLSYRLPLRPFFANIFGQLDYKRDMSPQSQADGSIFMRLCCPTNVGCRVQKAYQDQLEQLKDALVEDVRFADSDTVSSSWLSLASGRTVFQQKEGCFYLLVPPEVWKDRAIAGGVFEADVSLSRFQQEVRGEISQDEPIPVISTPTTFVEMTTEYLERYLSSGSESLAFVRYPEDLLPIRDRASADGARFTFKDARITDYHPHDDPSVLWPTTSARGRQKSFQCHLFGEIATVLELTREKSVGIELRCPVGVTCCAARLFCDQLCVLRTLINKDCEDAVGECATSWFGLDTHDSDAYMAADTFWVYCVPGRAKKYSDLVAELKVGMAIDVEVGFQRFDLQDEDVVFSLVMRLINCPSCAFLNDLQHYYMAATRVAFLDERMLPRRGESYICDITPVPSDCKFCK
ncbi:hypothetical protein C8F04DRAFT_1196681 [Mycena alexandri]|uniref:F-box domain-containing protein n=1 Tax=Mycena alexandri TaxID=1745969 RepID=A0AAD6WQX9_9AGAR|nr:hypothetical protein C8F04DRAFT_1196681 [Mycena alexandri]